MLRRDPRLVVGFRASGNSRAIGSWAGDVGLADFACGALRLLVRGEELSHPGAVDEVARTAEEGGEEEVEEDSKHCEWGSGVRDEGGSVHLRIEDRDWSLDDADGFVERGDFAELALWMLDNSCNAQNQILWVQFSVDDIFETVGFAGGNLNTRAR